MPLVDTLPHRESISAVYGRLLPGGGQTPDELDEDIFSREAGPFYTPEHYGITDTDLVALNSRAENPTLLANFYLHVGEINEETHTKICTALGQLSQQDTLGIPVVNCDAAASQVRQSLTNGLTN